MTISKTATILAMALILTGPAIAPAGGQSQETSKAQGMPPLPKAGPEHALFKEDEGAWEAAVEMFMAPGAPPMTAKGVETNTVGCGGLCLITDFKGELMPGMPFHGHGVSVWDSAKKKYVGSWTDSMSQGLAVSESTWDPAARTMTGFMEGPDASGKVTRTKGVTEYKGGSRVFTMYGSDAAGKEAATMRITYTRKK